MAVVQLWKYLVSSTGLPYFGVVVALSAIGFSCLWFQRKRNSGPPTDEEEETRNEFVPVLDHELDVDHIPFIHQCYSEAEMKIKSKEFYELMNKRRTLRFFSDRHVPSQIIRDIVRTAGTSPSGAHT